MYSDAIASASADRARGGAGLCGIDPAAGAAAVAALNMLRGSNSFIVAPNQGFRASAGLVEAFPLCLSVYLKSLKKGLGGCQSLPVRIQNTVNHDLDGKVGPDPLLQLLRGIPRRLPVVERPCDRRR